MQQQPNATEVTKAAPDAGAIRRHKIRVQAERKMQALTAHQPEINWHLLSTIGQLLAYVDNAPEREIKAIATKILRKLDWLNAIERDNLQAALALNADHETYEKALSRLVKNNRVTCQEFVGRKGPKIFVIKQGATQVQVQAALNLYAEANKVEWKNFKGKKFLAKMELPEVTAPQHDPEMLGASADHKHFGDSYQQALEAHWTDATIPTEGELPFRAAGENTAKVRKSRPSIKATARIHRERGTDDAVKNAVRADNRRKRKLLNKLNADGIDTKLFADTIKAEKARVAEEKRVREFTKALTRFNAKLEQLHYLARKG